jgi:fructose-1,6-bisphosphatase/inositol monophosphatase family enzyme
MPKRVFWPAALVAMGLIYLASNMGYLPAQFWDFWPVLLIVVGLGGLLTSDRDEWLGQKPSRSAAASSKAKSRSTAKKKR